MSPDEDISEAIYAITIYIRGDESGPLATTIPVAAPVYDHDAVLAELVADIVASELALPPSELVGLGQPSTLRLPGSRAIGWVMDPEDQHQQQADIPAMVEQALAWFAAEALDVSWLETEYLPSQW